MAGPRRRGSRTGPKPAKKTPAGPPRTRRSPVVKKGTVHEQRPSLRKGEVRAKVVPSGERRKGPAQGPPRTRNTKTKTPSPSAPSIKVYQLPAVEAGGKPRSKTVPRGTAVIPPTLKPNQYVKSVDRRNRKGEVVTRHTVREKKPRKPSTHPRGANPFTKRETPQPAPQPATPPVPAANPTPHARSSHRSTHIAPQHVSQNVNVNFHVRGLRLRRRGAPTESSASTPTPTPATSTHAHTPTHTPSSTPTHTPSPAPAHTSTQTSTSVSSTHSSAEKGPHSKLTPFPTREYTDTKTEERLRGFGKGVEKEKAAITKYKRKSAEARAGIERAKTRMFFKKTWEKFWRSNQGKWDARIARSQAKIQELAERSAQVQQRYETQKTAHRTSQLSHARAKNPRWQLEGVKREQQTRLARGLEGLQSPANRSTYQQFVRIDRVVPTRIEYILAQLPRIRDNTQRMIKFETLYGMLQDAIQRKDYAEAAGWLRELQNTATKV